jgi:hypothetical protein
MDGIIGLSGAAERWARALAKRVISTVPPMGEIDVVIPDP